MNIVRKTYVRSQENFNTIRADYILALLPAVIWSVIRYGFHAFEVIIVSAVSTALFDFIFSLLLTRKAPKLSLYSLYCGVFLGLSLYSATSVLIAGFAGLICAFVLSVLQGSGKSFVFAPIAARILAFELIPNRINKPDNMPFEELLFGELPTESTFDLIIGTAEGVLGSISVMAIALGVIYLLIRKSDDIRASASYIVAVAVLYFIFPLIKDNGAETALYEILSGDVLFVAFFALTDFATSPKTSAGKYIKGIICAILTFVLRRIGFTADGVFISVLISDITCVLCSNIAIKISTVKERKNA